MVEKLNINFVGKLDSMVIVYVEDLYIKYCVFCYGEDCEGYVVDFVFFFWFYFLLFMFMIFNFMWYIVQFG